MKRRPGQKIKLTSVEELLGVNNEESAIDIEIVKIRWPWQLLFRLLPDGWLYHRRKPVRRLRL